MSVTKRNYIQGDFESLTEEPIGQFTLNTWTHISFDGFFKFLFADPVVKVASTLVTVPATSYELLTDTRYTNLEAESAGSGKTVYAQIRITDATYVATELILTCANFGTYTDNEAVYALVNDVGELKTYPTYKDRTSQRLLPFAFDNAVSQTTYAALYAEIGDLYEDMHVAAGDSASGAGMFYPTPIPGYYQRTAIPDLSYASADRSSNALINITHHISRDGTPVKLIGDDIPAPLVSGTVYYVKVNSTTSISFATTEANAIAGTVITLTDAGTGTFRLTQEGVEIGNAFQGHSFGISAGSAARLAYTNGSYGTGTNKIVTPDGSGVAYLNVESDGTNGTPRTSNETRPSTLYEFGYIRY